MAGFLGRIPWLRKGSPGLPTGAEAGPPASSPRSRRRALRPPEQLEDRLLPAWTPAGPLLPVPDARPLVQDVTPAPAAADPGAAAGIAPAGDASATDSALAAFAQDAPSPFAYRSPVAGELTLRLDGGDLRVVETGSGREVARRAVGRTSEVVISGVDFADDTLTVDFSRGKIPVPITYHGGVGGFDTLAIEGGRFARSSYLATAPDSGTITLDDQVVHYTGLEPITDTSVVDDRVFDDTTVGAQQIRLTDNGNAADGYTTIDSPIGGFESVSFRNPARSLTINAGDGDDLILLVSVDSGFTARVTINGGSGTNTLRGPDAPANFEVDGDHAGRVNVPVAVDFAGIAHLQGGSGADTFTVRSNATFAGTIDGRGGSDTVQINLGSGLGAITVADTGASGTDTLAVKSGAVGDVLSDSGTAITSTSYPSATIAYSGLEGVPSRTVPSGLLAFLVDKLGDYVAGLGPVSVPLFSGQLGDFLDLQDLVLDYTNVQHTGPTVTGGTVAISAKSGALFPGRPVTVTVSDGDDGDDKALIGTYDPIARTFALTIDQFDLDAAGRLLAHAAGVALAYDSQNAAAQTLVTIAALTVTLPTIDPDTALNVTGLTVRTDGFSLANATVNLPSVTWLGALTLTKPFFGFGNVNYTTAGGGSLTGTVSLGVDPATGSVALTLGGTSAFTSTVTGFVGSYGLGTGALSLTASAATLDLGGVVRLNARALNIALDARAGLFSFTTGLSTIVVDGFVTLSGTFALRAGERFGVEFSGAPPPAAKAVSAVTLGGSDIHAFLRRGRPLLGRQQQRRRHRRRRHPGRHRGLRHRALRPELRLGPADPDRPAGTGPATTR